MGFKNVSVIIDGRLFLGKSAHFVPLPRFPLPHDFDRTPVSFVSAQSTRSLTERRITHIVSVCTEAIPAEHPQSGIRHLRVPVQDQPNEDLLIWMPHTCRFIDEALRSGGVVLVHGVHGLSRGATIMAAYCMFLVLSLLHPHFLTPSPVMWSRRVSAAEAIDIVRRSKVALVICFDRLIIWHLWQLVNRSGSTRAFRGSFRSSSYVVTRHPWKKVSMCAGARASTTTHNLGTEFTH